MSDIVQRLRLRADLEDDAPWIRRDYRNAADEIERLQARVTELVTLLDIQLGTPCEQIRHEQEIERLQAALFEEVAVHRQTDDALAKAEAEIERLQEDGGISSQFNKPLVGLKSIPTIDLKVEDGSE